MDRLEEIKGRIEEAKEARERLLALVEEGDEMAIDRYKSNRTLLERFSKHQEDLEERLAEAESSEQPIAEVERAVEEWNRIMGSGDEGRISEVKIRLNAHLKRVFHRIIVNGPRDFDFEAKDPLSTEGIWQRELDERRGIIIFEPQRS